MCITKVFYCQSYQADNYVHISMCITKVFYCQSYQADNYVHICNSCNISCTNLNVHHKSIYCQSYQADNYVHICNSCNIWTNGHVVPSILGLHQSISKTFIAHL